MGFLLVLDPLMNSRRGQPYEPQRNEDINMVNVIDIRIIVYFYKF